MVDVEDFQLTAALGALMVLEFLELVDITLPGIAFSHASRLE